MTNNYFIGEYVKEIALTLVVSALSHVHCLVVGDPGIGKTQIALRVQKYILGDDEVGSITRLNPTSRPENLVGVTDVMELVNHGKLVMILDGTPSHPDCRIAIIDELSRAPDAAHDIILGLLDKIEDKATNVIGWCTANFVNKNSRNEAMFDRIGLVWWQPPKLHLDWDAIIRVNAIAGNNPLDVSADWKFPEWKDVKRIQDSPRKESHVNMAIEFLLEVVDLVQKSVIDDDGKTRKWALSPRRVKQWQDILINATRWFSGVDDFTSLHENAMKALSYAYPFTTAEEAASWKTMISSIIDPIGTSIKKILDESIRSMNELTSMIANSQSDVKREEYVTEVGTRFQLGVSNMIKIAGPEDQRVVKAMDGLRNAWIKIEKGVSVEV